ncbi:MAG: cupin domain-containing protein [Chloroflexi bacterium]|nr:cupin domain-containing protein [Chloroflexota bacterium]
MTRYVFSTTDTIRYRYPTHVNDLVLDRVEAATTEVFIVVLEPGEAPPLHQHDDTEQIFYIMEGAGMLTIGDPAQHFSVKPGDVIRIPPHTLHSIKCDSHTTLRYLSVDAFVGEKSAAEPTWDSHVQTLCARFGWDFNQVKLQN